MIKRLMNYILHGVWTECDHTERTGYGFEGKWKCKCGARG